MKLNEFLNTCQNQFKDLLGRNEDFRIELEFEELSQNKNEKTYILDSYYDDDENYLLKYRLREINFWEMRYKDKLYIEIKGHY